jgi:uncharacterized protein (DUF924 family)
MNTGSQERVTPDAASGSARDGTVDDILHFWRSAGLQSWFAKDDAFDSVFRDRFLGLYFEAAARHCDAWAATADGTLALLILLDQFPRNAFRGTAHMFATDGLALMFARGGLAAGHDTRLGDDCRVCFYLPFTHSENLADQDLAVTLRRALCPRLERRAAEHRDIIYRFGRFPHRNALLGRETTPEEADFLASGGFAG